jgi:predicted chitinase
MIPVTVQQIKKLAPLVNDAYLSAFEKANDVLALYGINANALRVSHFLAQIFHETGGLTILSENLNYSASRMMAVWPSRFPTLESAKPYEHHPEALANKVYGGRMGNRDAGDGWLYRGRGMVQCTGRESYARFGKLLGINLVGNPELAIHPDHALSIAAVEFQTAGCNAFADVDDVKLVTKAINGGFIGLDERKAWLVKTKAVFAEP